ncbi:hypothetical protein [Listeria booriae]|uniref:hypothetical protein n=1 Tax=Listeria booriae TaxID=1552123 RepID=UPI001628C66A|nr:hypothetical protein [Listeria booriae]MBC1504573.1 hypothetical protein [Listeria booriae]
MESRSFPDMLLHYLARNKMVIEDLEEKLMQDIGVFDEHVLREILEMLHRYGYIFLIYTNKEVICCITTKGRKIAGISQMH